MTRPLSRPQRLASLVAIAATLLLAACSPDAGLLGSPAPGNQRVEAPPASPVPTGAAAPAATSRVMSGDELVAIYALIVTNYVDPVDHRLLLREAQSRLRDSLAQERLHPLLTAPVDLLPEPADEPGPAWRQFSVAYDSVTQGAPAWATRVHADWLVLDGMLDSLRDGASSFRSAEEVARTTDAPGGFGGVGLVMFPSKDPNAAPLVQEVIEGGPAESVGIEPGDRILAVNGVATPGLSLDEVRRAIRGNPGTEVVLRIRRFGIPNPADVRIRRALVQIAPVSADTYLGEVVGHLKIRNFNEASVANQIEVAIEQGKALGIKGWIIDLRGNQGGDLITIATVASYFVGDKPLGYEVSRDKARTPVVVAGNPLIKDVPIAVLVDGITASGAELLAAALKEHGVATIIGVQTDGLVDLSQSLTLSDGSRVQFAVQHLETPLGARLTGIGLTPDRVVPTAESDLEQGDDPPLRTAVELMIQRLGLPPLR